MPTAAEEWQRSILESGRQAFAAGHVFVAEVARADWSDALAEGLVSTSWERAFYPTTQAIGQSSAVEGRFTPPGTWSRMDLSIGDVQDMGREIGAAIDGLVGEISGDFPAQVARQFGELAEEAIREGWTESKFAAEAERLAGKAGLKEYRKSWASTWYRTYVIDAAFNLGVLVRFQTDPTSRLYPFLRYDTMRDSRVRPSHRELEGFIAATTWSGWPAILPPNGYNCRCRISQLSWKDARALDLAAEGNFPPGMEQVFESWTGPDEKFRKLWAT